MTVSIAIQLIKLVKLANVPTLGLPQPPSCLSKSCLGKSCLGKSSVHTTIPSEVGNGGPSFDSLSPQVCFMLTNITPGP